MLVERKVHLHLTVDGKIGELSLHVLHSLVNLHRASALLSSEVGVAQHGYHGFIIEELHSVLAQLGNVGKHLGIRMTVDERIGNIICTLA